MIRNVIRYHYNSLHYIWQLCNIIFGLNFVHDFTWLYFINSSRITTWPPVSPYRLHRRVKINHVQYGTQHNLFSFWFYNQINAKSLVNLVVFFLFVLFIYLSILVCLLLLFREISKLFVCISICRYFCLKHFKLSFCLECQHPLNIIDWFCNIVSIRTCSICRGYSQNIIILSHILK